MADDRRMRHILFQLENCRFIASYFQASQFSNDTLTPASGAMRLLNALLMFKSAWEVWIKAPKSSLSAQFWFCKLC